MISKWKAYVQLTADRDKAFAINSWNSHSQGTVFGQWYGNSGDDNVDMSSFLSSKEYGSIPAKGMAQLPSASDSAFMYKYAAGYLRAKGYEHYEVSSYALRRSQRSGPASKGSFRSQHNQLYWALNGQWLAVGLGATSFINGHTVARPRELFDYVRWVDDVALTIQSNEGNHDDEVMDDLDDDFLMDTVLKRLRTSDGLSLNWVEHRFGQSYVDAILRGCKLGFVFELVRLDRETKILGLVDPEGFLFSNSIISSIFVELEGINKNSTLNKL
jgi:coproporphyrinogen III oxidase-like Fe-S oxidoreductase